MSPIFAVIKKYKYKSAFKHLIVIFKELKHYVQDKESHFFPHFIKEMCNI